MAIVKMKDDKKFIQLLKEEARQLSHDVANYTDETIMNFVDTNLSEERAVPIRAKMYLKHYMLGNVPTEQLAQMMAMDDRFRHTVSDICNMRLEYSPINVEHNGHYIDLRAGALTFWSEIHAPLPSELAAAKDARLLAIGIEAARRAGIPGYENGAAGLDDAKLKNAPLPDVAEEAKPKKDRKSLRERLDNMVQGAAQYGAEKLAAMAEKKRQKQEERMLNKMGITREQYEAYKENLFDGTATFLGEVADALDEAKEKTASNEDVVKLYGEARKNILLAGSRYDEDSDEVTDDITGEKILWPDVTNSEYELTDADKGRLALLEENGNASKFVGCFKEFDGAYRDLRAGKEPGIERNEGESDVAYQMRQEAMVAYLGARLTMDATPKGVEPQFSKDDLLKLSYYGSYLAGKDKNLELMRADFSDEVVEEPESGKHIYWTNDNVPKRVQNRLDWTEDTDKMEKFMEQFKDFDKAYRGESVLADPHDTNTHALLYADAYNSYKNIRDAVEGEAEPKIDMKDAAKLVCFSDYMKDRARDKAIEERLSRAREPQAEVPTIKLKSGYSFEELASGLDSSILQMLDDMKAKVDAEIKAERKEQEAGKPEPAKKDGPSFEERKAEILAAGGMTEDEYNNIPYNPTDPGLSDEEWDKVATASNLTKKIAESMTIDEYKAFVTNQAPGTELPGYVQEKGDQMIQTAAELVEATWLDRQAAERFDKLKEAGYSGEAASKIVIDDAIKSSPEIQAYRDALSTDPKLESLRNLEIVNRAYEYVYTNAMGEKKDLPERDVTHYKDNKYTITGKMNNKSVTFSKESFGHEFTKDEISKLLSGEAINFDAVSKGGKSFAAVGTLGTYTKNGEERFGFVLRPYGAEVKSGLNAFDADDKQEPVSKQETAEVVEKDGASLGEDLAAGVAELNGYYSEEEESEGSYVSAQEMYDMFSAPEDRQGSEDKDNNTDIGQELSEGLENLSDNSDGLDFK